MRMLYKRMRQFKEQWGAANCYRKMYGKGGGKWSSLIQLDVERTLGSIHNLRYCLTVLIAQECGGEGCASDKSFGQRNERFRILPGNDFTCSQPFQPPQ